MTIDSGTQPTPFFAEDIEVLTGGRTIVYGSFPLPGSSSSGILAFTASGAIDSTWNGGVPIAWDSSFQIPQRTLVVDASERVLAREGTVIARFTATGAPDATWGGDGVSISTSSSPSVSTASGSTTSRSTATRWW